jgi:hypothetical protein
MTCVQRAAGVGAGTAGAAGDYATPNCSSNGELLTRTVLQTSAGVELALDPCASGTKILVPISQATSTQVLTGTASMRTYVCDIAIMQLSTSTQTWSLVSGTGTVCATSTSALIGATTAANGSDLSLQKGNGAAWVLKTDTDADNVCLLQSSTDRINGSFTYVVAAN